MIKSFLPTSGSVYVLMEFTGDAMGWFFVSILLPVLVPMVFMALAGLVPTLPPAILARTRLMLLVQNGQLGWAAVGFSASCSYEVYAYMNESGLPFDFWMALVLVMSLATLAISGFLAALGALFPIDETQPLPTAWRQWVKRHRLFLMTLIALVTAATSRCAIHYNFLA